MGYSNPEQFTADKPLATFGFETKRESKEVFKMENKSNKPEKTFSTGAIQVTVWKNQGTSKEGTKTDFRTVNIQRRYADKTGEWKTTSTLRINDLPRASLVLNKAFEYIVMKGQDSEFIEEIVV